MKFADVLIAFCAFAIQVAIGASFYLLGRMEGKQSMPICPKPTISAETCAPVWFGGKPGDMALARQRICRKVTS